MVTSEFAAGRLSKYSGILKNRLETAAEAFGDATPPGDLAEFMRNGWALLEQAEFSIKEWESLAPLVARSGPVASNLMLLADRCQSTAAKISISEVEPGAGGRFEIENAETGEVRAVA